MRRSVYSRFVIGLAVCAALIGAVGTWARRANHGIPQLQIANKTRSLIVESITELDSAQVGKKTLRRFKVTVKNGYSQPVVAYAFQQQDKSVGQGTSAAVETNGAAIGWVLAPNATDETQFSVPSEGDVVITLAAVLLKDGTGDGDVGTVSRLKENRAGVKLAYEQIVPLLRPGPTSDQDPGSEAVIEAVENHISFAADERKVERNLRRGFREAKELIVTDLRELKTRARAGQHLEYRAEIDKIRARVEDVLTKL